MGKGKRIRKLRRDRATDPYVRVAQLEEEVSRHKGLASHHTEVARTLKARAKNLKVEIKANLKKEKVKA